jgi:Delta3-Delta2-enoyl-CoA isomerase
MGSIDWKVDDNIAVLSMNYGENRFNIKFLNEMLAALDDIEKKTEVTALVVHSEDQKIWSNGMDLEWLIPAVTKNDPDVDNFFKLQDILMKRVLFFPMITVAALSGHAFASGAIFSCCFDFRFMRSDRGYLCFPEVDLNIPFLPYMTALIKRALPTYLAEEAQFTGKRYTAVELEKAHFVRKACLSAELLNEATAFAKSLNKGRWIISEHKKYLYHDIGILMDQEQPRAKLNDIPIK